MMIQRIVYVHLFYQAQQVYVFECFQLNKGVKFRSILRENTVLISLKRNTYVPFIEF